MLNSGWFDLHTTKESFEWHIPRESESRDYFISIFNIAVLELGPVSLHTLFQKYKYIDFADCTYVHILYTFSQGGDLVGNYLLICPSVLWVFRTTAK